MTNYDGAEEIFKELIEAVNIKREEFQKIVFEDKNKENEKLE